MLLELRERGRDGERRPLHDGHLIDPNPGCGATPDVEYARLVLQWKSGAESDGGEVGKVFVYDEDGDPDDLLEEVR
jgi:hypothetical protein